MIRTVLILIALVLMPGLKAQDIQATKKTGGDSFALNELFADWYIVKYINIGSVFAYTDEQEAAFIGKRVSLQRNCAVRIGDSCMAPVYKILDHNDVEKYLKDEKIDIKKLGTTGHSVYVIKLSCGREPTYHNDQTPEFATDLIYDRHHLFFLYNGTYFMLSKKLK